MSEPAHILPFQPEVATEAPPAKRTPVKLPNFLSDGETEKLIETCRVLRQAAEHQAQSKRDAAARDELCVHLGLFAGLRVGEMCSLEIKRIDLAAGQLLVFQGKGAKDRYVPVSAKLAEVLRAAIGVSTDGLLMRTARGEALTVDTAEWRIERLGKLAGFGRKLKPHTLRHTFAVRLVNTGTPIHEVRDLLGHSSIAVTDVYLRCTTQRLRAAVDRL